MAKNKKEPNTPQAKDSNQGDINIRNINDILVKILNSLEGNYSQIKRKDSVIVLVVEHVLKVAKELGLGLSKINGLSLNNYANYVQIENKKDLQSLESLTIISGEDGTRTHGLLTAS